MLPAQLQDPWELNLSVEVILLLLLGIFMLLFGLLLFDIHTGVLPYSPDSTYGLFLVIISLQIITLGKTPFGDLNRSWLVVIGGICTAILGMFACFIPGLLTGIIRIMVGILLFAGGITLMLRLCTEEDKARKWLKIPGVLQHLTLACGLVYLLAVVIGFVTFLPGITTDQQTAVLLMIYGASFFYLTWCIWKAARVYPPGEQKVSQKSEKAGSGCFLKSNIGLFREASISLPAAILLLLGVLLILLGVLLIPVSLGVLPFSPDGQLGLLLFIISIQILATGNTPVGQYRRSWPLMLIGTGFGAMGIVSCIVPGLLTGAIRQLLGLLSIANGIVPLSKQIFTATQHNSSSAALAEIPPVAKKMRKTQTILSIVSIIFGLTIFIPGLIAGLAIAGILIVNGLLVFELAYLLRQVT